MTFLRSEAITRIQRGLGFRSDQSDAIVSSLKEAQRHLERGKSLPWFLVQENVTLTFLTGSADVSLPTGFLREKEGESVYLIDTTTGAPVFLEKVSFDEGSEIYTDDDATSMRPQAYTVRKASIRSWPVGRDTSYHAFWSYYKAADELSSDIQNAWLEHAPEVLIGRAGIILARDLRNKSAVELFTEMYVEAWKGVFAQGIDREDVGDPIRVGGRL